MVIFWRKQQGATLIELMVMITILGVLAVAGTSLTSLWSKQAELDKAIMSLQSAMNLARSTAIRNEFSQNVDYAASQLCFDQNTRELSVHKATVAGSASCSSTAVFSYPLNSKIEIKHMDTTTFKCFSFNHFGQVVTEITGNCKTNLSLVVSNGSLNETKKLD